MIINETIQQKWQDLQMVGYDAIVYGDGSMTLGSSYSLYDPNTDKTAYYWRPTTDAHIDGILKYNDDPWVDVDIYNGSFIYKNQKIVFGEGSMGNEGFIASTTLNGQLNWSIFFDFSNPINKADIIEDILICYGDTGCKIEINLNALHDMNITWDEAVFFGSSDT